MTPERRAVRATSRFFADLDRQIAADRGPNGEPSTNDFQVFDLFRIVETFATRFDHLEQQAELLGCGYGPSNERGTTAIPSGRRYASVPVVSTTESSNCGPILRDSQCR